MCPQMSAQVIGDKSVAEYLVMKRARDEGVKVVLSGHGPDELFAGYSRYRPLRAVDALREGRLWEAASAFRASCRWPDTPALVTLAWCAHYLAPQGYAEFFRRVVGRDLVPTPLKADYFLERNAAHTIGPKPYAGMPFFARHRYEDVFSIGLQGQLAWSDQASMAHSVEGRLPFLLPVLAEFAFGLPSRYLVDAQGTCKAVLREAVRGIVPDEVLTVRRKLGFQTDETDYLAELRPVLIAMFRNGEFDDLPFLSKGPLEQTLESSRPLPRRYWRLACLHWWGRVNGLEYD